MDGIREIWRDGYRINVYESDVTGRVSIPALCDYCQDSASRHYFSIDRVIGPMLLPSQIWALTRIEMEIDGRPPWNETIEVETWSRRIEKAFAYRDFLLRDQAGRVFARATTTWVVLDRDAMRIVRLEDFSLRWPSIAASSALGRDAEKIAGPASMTRMKPFDVGYGDIDVNRHVNSVRYVRWMIDALGQKVLEGNEIRRMIVNFIDEAVVGEEVRTASGRGPGSEHLEFAASVVRCRDNKEICRSKFFF